MTLAAEGSFLPQVVPWRVAGVLTTGVVAVGLSGMLGAHPAAAGLGLAVAVALTGTPYGPLGWCIGCFALTLGYEEGSQIGEVVFLAYYVVYLPLWAGLRVLVYRERVLRGPVDIAVAVFLLLLAVSVVPAALFRASPVAAVSESLNYSLFALYFPARELCRRYERGGVVVLGLLAVLGLAALMINVTLVRTALADAEVAWQIARGRVAMNEMLLTVSALTTLSLALYTPRWPRRAVLLGLFVVFAGSVFIAQSRAYYVDLVLGLLLVVVLAPAGTRGWLAVLGVIGLGLLWTLAWILYGADINLVALGIVDRFLSIGTATSSDISYLNRRLENRAAWALIRQNPILGYGPGVSFGFHDAISQRQWVKTFVHNGYLMLWYKFGILGLSAVLTAWGTAIARVLMAVRSPNVPRVVAGAGLAAGITLVSLLPSHALSATFATAETVLCVALLLGVAEGVWTRVQPPAVPTS